jgi:hypothetical protein
MQYKYSICHPNKETIERPKNLLNKGEVLSMALNYAWEQQLDLLESLKEGEICYSPSLGFEEVATGFGIDISVIRTKGKMEFSLWYNRMVNHKPFFGLFGVKNKMKVIDKWGFDMERAIEYLKVFVAEDYKKLEELMKS